MNKSYQALLSLLTAVALGLGIVGCIPPRIQQPLWDAEDGANVAADTFADLDNTDADGSTTNRDTDAIQDISEATDTPDLQDASEPLDLDEQADGIANPDSVNGSETTDTTPDSITGCGDRTDCPTGFVCTSVGGKDRCLCVVGPCDGCGQGRSCIAGEHCSASDECVCGSLPTTALQQRLPRVDQCDGDKYVCGIFKDECPGGFSCVSGECTCTESAGCVTCKNAPGDRNCFPEETCQREGQQLSCRCNGASISVDKADSCSQSGYTCGPNPQCQGSFECVASKCRCSASQCDTGCSETCLENEVCTQSGCLCSNGLKCTLVANGLDCGDSSCTCTGTSQCPLGYTCNGESCGCTSVADDGWCPQKTITGLPIDSLLGFDSKNVFAVNKTLYAYDGKTWTAVDTSPEVVSARTIWGSGPDELFVGGDNGVLLHYYQGKWLSVDAGAVNRKIRWLFGTSATEIFAVGENGFVSFFDGAKWTPQDLGGYSGASFESVWAASSSEVYVVGKFFAEGMLVFNGSSWAAVGNFAGGLNTVFGLGSKDVYVGGPSGLFHYDGAKFDPVTLPLAGEVSHVWAPQQPRTYKLFVVVSGKGIIGFTGSEFKILTSSNSPRYVWASDEGEVFFSQYASDGVIHHHLPFQ